MIHLLNRVMSSKDCVGYIVEDATGYRFYVKVEDLHKYAISNSDSIDLLPEIKEVVGE